MRIVRSHSVYGPLGTYEGGREKAPAAISRKVALAPNNGGIEIWGDGVQTRSFMYVDDCVEGVIRLMVSDYQRPLNLGTDRLISINELVDLVCSIAGKKVTKKHDLSRPQGVRGRNSDNDRLRKVLAWEPSISLEQGLRVTYAWIESELGKAGDLYDLSLHRSSRQLHFHRPDLRKPFNMRILVIGINYAPETTGIAPYTTGLCEHLAGQGHSVSIITAFPYYPEWKVRENYRGRFYQRELINGVNVRRVWHFVPSRASDLLQRLGHDLSFSLSALLAASFAGGFDIIYCACPPPTAAFSAYLLGKMRRKPYFIKLEDLASDAAIATGILKEGLALRLALATEGFVYRGAERIICLCQGFVETLKARGISKERLRLIPDWADTERIRPVLDAKTFRRTHDLSDEQFLLLHSGNMGKKQDLMNVVRAAEMSQDKRELLWLLVGHGEEQTRIQKEITRCGLANIRLLPLQPSDQLAEMYSASDVLLLNQQAGMKDAVIPSKLLTYMAAGRAVLAAVNEESEAARQIRRAQCGLVVAPENPKALVEAALSLRRDPCLRQGLGAKGRAYAVLNFTKRKVLEEYDALFSGLRSEQESEPEIQKKSSAAPQT